MSDALGMLPVDEAARLARSEGFEGVQLTLAFSDTPCLTPGEDLKVLSDRFCSRINKAFQNAEVEVFALSAYVGLVEPEAEKRRGNLEFLKAMLRSAQALGTRIVVTEVGTRGSVEDNQSEDGWRTLVESITELAPVAEAENVCIALEPTRTQTLNTAARARKFVEQIGSSNLKLLIDPASILSRPEASELEEMFNFMIPYLVAGHAKDVRFKDSDCDYSRAGLGQLDYLQYVRLMKKHLPGGPLIIECVDGGSYREARDFLRGVMIASESPDDCSNQPRSSSTTEAGSA